MDIIAKAAIDNVVGGEIGQKVNLKPECYCISLLTGKLIFVDVMDISMNLNLGKKINFSSFRATEYN